MEEKKVTKAMHILTVIRTERKLKPLCETLGLSYKYVYAISCGTKPSDKTIDALRTIIKPEYWNELVTPEFIQLYATEAE